MTNAHGRLKRLLNSALAVDEVTKALRTAWLACRGAGIRRLPHDLRRTAVRNLERAGVPRAAAMAMVGHKTESIYRRYSIVDARTLTDAAAKLAVL
jgi:hypothetical protein